MKKKILVLIGALVLISTYSVAYSYNIKSPEMATAVKLYKSGDYVGCYSHLQSYTKRDTSDALAYYYLAMSSVQIGKKDEAIANYEKALRLAYPGSNLEKYAKRGKICLESPEECSKTTNEISPDELLIKRGQNFTNKVRSDYERLKIENMMREINRSDSIEPQKFEEYKDFSSMNRDEVPTNEDIVAAMRTLQKAGFGDMINNSNTSFDLLGGNNKNAAYAMMGANSFSPELMQAFLTNGMGF